MSKEIFILIGPPCSGKGTQCEMLTAQNIIECFTIGNMLRENYPEGTKERTQIDNGEIINEDIINETVERIIKDKLSSKTSKLLIDGYPRTVNQAKSIIDFINQHNLNMNNNSKDQISITTIVFATENTDALRMRMTNRQYCSICQKTYDKQTQECCSKPLSKRNDDTIEVFQKRLHLYHQNIDEIRSILENVITINAMNSKKENHEIIRNIINSSKLE